MAAAGGPAGGEGAAGGGEAGPHGGTGRGIAVAAVLIMLGNVVSRLLGLVRGQTIGALYGVTAAADVFNAANRVPTMVYDLLIGGAITAALVPVFSEYAARDDGAAGPRRKGEGDLERLAGTVLGLALVVLVPALALLILAAGPLMSLLGVGFPPAVRAQGMGRKGTQALLVALEQINDVKR